ncbi:MAG TPA: hypothetical protein VFD71_13655 [Planctomycetota bacterium]|jgi:HEAT repeat protein|nr:hypothetical protein [Planctomycetota bacterium]
MPNNVASIHLKLLSHPDVHVRMAAAQELLHHATWLHALGPDEIRTVAARLEDEPEAFRVTCLALLANCGGRAAPVVSSIAKALHDPAEHVRCVAAGAFENLGTIAKPYVAALRSARHRALRRNRFRYTLALLSVERPVLYPWVAAGNQLARMAVNLARLAAQWAVRKRGRFTGRRAGYI